ncbi:putative 3-ketoacyl-CoA synthase 2 [Apostasia shenzhenica]|uniref:3-ketoacyl-CoA synthase n=1 Tax=Apostasia shenzhenica TaxID=1088818 RepID=A0A2H9ZWE5_9ASPA|nr:putative 3-ketoacyl-CoA synthase 2 [Apostasia shenzhenica]
MQQISAGAASIFIFWVLTVTLSLAPQNFLPLPTLPLLSILWCSSVAAAAYLSSRPLPIFLLDYSCYRPDPNNRCSLETCEYIGLRSRRYSTESADFMRAIYRKSGLGDETYGPPYIFQPDLAAKFPYAIVEADEGMSAAVASVLSKADVPSEKISTLIVACSMFSPAPSLASLLVNRFRFRPDIKSFNLSGMGCSAGTLGVDLAAKILRRSPGYALLVVTEATGLNWYFGENRHMLVTNCIFRAGTAAALLSSDPAGRAAAKFQLTKTFRTHHGSDDAAYNAATQSDDGYGGIGVALTKDLVRVAGASLRSHISALAPRVLPASELLRYAWRVVRSLARGERKEAASHVPDFTAAFEHVCIHAGGKAVIDAIGRIMGFSDRVVEPARMCLHRFGNTSSSLVFYELSYFEAKGRLRKGDRVWMLAFGTGFKACSVVWRALKDGSVAPDNPWRDCVHRYPVKPSV